LLPIDHGQRNAVKCLGHGQNPFNCGSFLLAVVKTPFPASAIGYAVGRYSVAQSCSWIWRNRSMTRRPLGRFVLARDPVKDAQY
jgi:hypothetical protein